LLIVVGILAALAAILLPTLGRARRQAAQLLCQSNLRQWDLAVIAYANENRGCLPRRGQGTQPTAVLARPEDWFNALPPLLGMEPYADLAARHAVPRPEDRGVWNCGEAVNVGEATFFSYAMNMRLSTWVAPEPDRIDRVGPTATMVFMADAPAGYCSVLPAAAPYSPVARHTGSVNVSFLDGHVASYAGNEVGCGTGDPLRDDVRWVVPGSPWAGPQ
jgi:prepilin-type processing-associated H-X9-DG protein